MVDDSEKTQVVGGAGAAAGPRGTPPAKLICSDPSALEEGEGAQILLIDERPVTVGRSREANVRILSESISRVHAKLYPGGGFWGIKDLGSTNGIKVNGAKVEQAWMRDGDAVVIGKVEYAFTQDKPKPAETESAGGGEAGFTDTIVSDRTMFVGQDTSAASALLKSTKAAAEDDADSPATSPTINEPTKTGTSGAQAAPVAATGGRKNKTMVVVAGVIGVLVIAGAAVMFLGGGGPGAAVEENNRRIERFIARNERAGVVSGGALTEQVDEIQDIDQALGGLIAQYPDSAELHEMRAVVAFLDFTRKFEPTMKARDIQTARRHLTAVRGAVGKTEQNRGNGSAGAIAQRYDEVASLVELAAASITLKSFVLTYRNPDSDSGKQPSAEALDEVLDARRRFATLKRQHNLAVTVTYPFFGSAMEQIADSDLSLLDRWQRAMQ